MKKISYFGFAYTNSYQVGLKYYNSLYYLSLLLAFLSFILIPVTQNALLSFFINIFLAFSFKTKKITEIPAYFLLSLNSILYIQIPVLFILSKDINYNFELHTLMPKDSLFYFTYSFSSILIFFTSYLFLVCGLFIGNKIKLNSLKVSISHFNKSSTLNVILILVLVASSIIYFDMSSSALAKATEAEKKENFFALLLNDKMMPILISMLLYRFRESKKVLKIFLFTVSIYMFLNLYGGSKAAILLIFIFFFLVPLSVLYNSDKKIIWPSNKLILLGFICAPVLYLLSFLYRSVSIIAVNYEIVQVALGFSSLPLIYEGLKTFDYMTLIDLILNRFSVSLNNYIIIFSEFFNFSDFSYRLEYLDYAYKGLINLILPGTPFPDSYIPTSQLFNQVVNKEPLSSGLGRVSFLRQANTQPYSLFGFFTIISGPLSIFVSFIFGFMFSIVYKIIDSDFLKALLIMSLFAFMQVYSIEGQIQFTLFLLVPAFMVYIIIRFFDRLKHLK